MSTAICQAVEEIVRRYTNKWKNEIALRIQADTVYGSGSGTAQKQLVEVLLKPPSDALHTYWSIDSAQIEAILGLWVWTIMSDPHVRAENDPNSPLAEMIPCSRIISASLADGSWGSVADREGVMEHWVGSSAPAFQDTTLELDRQSSCGIASLWAARGRDRWEPLPPDEGPSRRDLRRFCGWNAFDPSNILDSGGARRLVSLQLQTTSTSGSLLDVCVRELFTSLAMSCMSILLIASTTITENGGSIHLSNPTLSTLAKVFVENGLGSYSEALLCLVPASRGLFKQPDMVPTAVQAATTHRKAKEWDRAETVLRWACVRHEQDPRLLARALRALGEMYRSSFARSGLARGPKPERRRFAERGFRWMTDHYGSKTPHYSHLEVAHVVGIYHELGTRFADSEDFSSVKETIPEIMAQHPLIEALDKRDKLEALYRLCLVRQGELDEEPLRAALPIAVRNDIQSNDQNILDDWGEVVDAILGLGANLDYQDKGGRTAVSYCAEVGHVPYAERLVRLGASPEKVDEEKRTPLHLAAEFGRQSMAEFLVDTADVDVNAKDRRSRTPLHEAAASGHYGTTKLLLDRGASIGATDSSSRTPLHLAAEEGHRTTAELLLEHGADIEARDWAGATPLYAAAEKGRFATIELLLDNGADIEAATRWQRPLHRAAEKGHYSAVKLLLERGANVNAETGDFLGHRQTALGLAIKNRHKSIIELLTRWGATVTYLPGFRLYSPRVAALGLGRGGGFG